MDVTPRASPVDTCRGDTENTRGQAPDAALFVCTVIRAERFRYSYGRKWGLEQMRNTELRLPVTDDGAPDWELMARYTRSLPYSGTFAAA
ncbi:hypothetical protein [Mycobacteroides abscessus]|uniref:hypothetical protein n=1 Tax=Mycobacteroides abscessus TaxID=36809 RepID=UPI0005E8B01D|nr:hypothetical protein [Mycobacteroides abscessus]CPW95038.1 Uncharacterised protein [Mycobacteroides abscessus]SKU66927.1 Uncharacterised protein [Mycobacteroides abscessus subsp. abscessus]